MEYEVYRHKDATDEEFYYIDSFFKRVLGEDKDLCNAAQKNLNGGIFVNGQLHPKLESAPIFFQDMVRRLVTDHREKEKLENKEIWPACPSVEFPRATEEDIEFCSGLACEPERSAALEW